MTVEPEGRRILEPKRIKVTGCADNWTGYRVLCDGEELPTMAVSLNVEVDERTTVTLVLDATAVEFDIRTPAEAEFYLRDESA